MKLFLLPLALALLIPAVHADSEPMAITSSQGKSMTARLRARLGDEVTVVRESDKKVFKLPVAGLDDKSKAAITDWENKGGNLAATFEVKVETGTSRKKTGSEDFDDQRVTLNPLISLKNLDPNRKSVAGKVTAIFLGRPVNESSYLYVFKSQTFDLASLDSLGSTEFAVERISSAYDRRGYAKFGHRYIGYAIVVHDADGGTIHLAQSVPTSIAEKNRHQLLGLKTGQTYNKEFKRLE